MKRLQLYGKIYLTSNRENKMPYQTWSYHMYGIKVHCEDWYIEDLKPEWQNRVENGRLIRPRPSEDQLLELMGLSKEYAGDARFDIDFMFVGAHFQDMTDDESKNQFKKRIRETFAKYLEGYEDKEHSFEEVSFSWTC